MFSNYKKLFGTSYYSSINLNLFSYGFATCIPIENAFLSIIKDHNSIYSKSFLSVTSIKTTNGPITNAVSVT